jgi:periplasmic divalent cation tolerance protein
MGGLQGACQRGTNGGRLSPPPTTMRAMADELQRTEVARFDDGSTARVVLITAPTDELARSLARALVEERLAACVNIVPGLTSVYAWQGEVNEDIEVLLLVKTTAERLELLATRVHELHPYDVPELVALTPREVEANYLAWLVASSAREEPGA